MREISFGIWRVREFYRLIIEDYWSGQYWHSLDEPTALDRAHPAREVWLCQDQPISPTARDVQEAIYETRSRLGVPPTLIMLSYQSMTDLRHAPRLRKIFDIPIIFD